MGDWGLEKSRENHMRRVAFWKAFAALAIASRSRLPFLGVMFLSAQEWRQSPIPRAKHTFTVSYHASSVVVEMSLCN